MLLFAFLVACTDGTDGKDTGEALVGDAAAGEALYTSNCASCHGADGSGNGTYPNLVEETPGLEDAEIEDIVLNGRGAMAGFPFDAQEMADLLAHLRATFG